MVLEKRLGTNMCEMHFGTIYTKIKIENVKVNYFYKKCVK